MAETDFIGKLPNCLLLHIISRLPYKEATRTCVLSTRWRAVLPRSRMVELDHTKLDTSEYESTIDKFSVTPSAPFPHDELRRCLSFAVESKARAMFIDLSHSSDLSFHLPRDVYAHKTLETLKLFSCNFVPSEFKNFRSLLHLSLGHMELRSSWLTDLVQNCVSLKSLRLENCPSVVEIIGGQASGLETLVIRDCSVWISVKAPNLKRFNYSGKFCNLELESMERLEEAALDFGDESEMGQVGDLLYQLFRDVYAVKVLSVCSFSLQIIPSGEEGLGLKPRLKKVKHLILKTRMHENEFYGIRFFLQSCPALERLSLEIEGSRRIFEEYECPFEESWDRGMPLYECVRTSVKVVDVKGFTGTSDQISLLAYFVFSAGTMHTLNIQLHSPLSLPKARILLQLRKASPNLRIHIS